MLNANKITNYLGNPISKNRPFVCFDIRQINKEKYYYFIPGTSKISSERKVKNFNKFYLKITQNSIINKLNQKTFFQVNIIYIIKETDLHIYSSFYRGKISLSEQQQISNLYNEAKKQEISAFMIYLEKWNKWFIGRVQKNFKEIASANNKRKNFFSRIISQNIKNDKKEINDYIVYQPFKDDLFKF